MTQPFLGVCYYPEHWPQREWSVHAREMRQIGISAVRIAEFAWSRIEPERGCFEWDWLDLACDTLAGEGLKLILCTPTACPPKWLMDEFPEIYPLDERGDRRRFGSRRHYCFSSARFRTEASRITRQLADRYSKHPAVVGWQVDNEYGCHDTALSYSPGALEQFRRWLRDKYDDIDALNRSWGTVFWSQEYGDFSAVELPAGAVTEANPSQRLDFQRFSSEQVRTFSTAQTDVIRENGECWVTHNFMGNFYDFDHFDVADDLDIASWDSYPLGFLDQGWFTEETKRRYRQTGHPDWASFHHDLYFACGRGRFGVMEQQPGPVNWASSNAQPLAGMVRLWSWEAVAHGAEFVSYFRWRQAPFGQEQMHSALQQVDGSSAPAMAEVERMADELKRVPVPKRGQSEVALVFDYESIWMTRIQPQTADFDPVEFVFAWYSALRQLGVDVDIVSPHMPMGDYKLIVAPHFARSDSSACAELLDAPAYVVLGPRTGSKTNDFHIPASLPPGALQARMPLKITSIDGIREGVARSLTVGADSYNVSRWLESVRSDLVPRAQTESGIGVWYEHGSTSYVNAWVCDGLLRRIMSEACVKAGVDTHELPADVRRSRIGDMIVLMNYGQVPQTASVDGAMPVLGNHELSPLDVSIWSESPDA